MKFRRGGHEVFFRPQPQFNGGPNRFPARLGDVLFFGGDFLLAVAALRVPPQQYAPVNAVDGAVGGWDHVEREKQPFQPMGNVVLATGR